MSQLSVEQNSFDSAVVAPNAYLLRSAIVPKLDRQLGYFGAARFVTFTYDPRTEGVQWNDGQSYGYGSGAWKPFEEYVQPLANELKVDLTTKGNSYVLLIDRLVAQAYFIKNERADVMIRNQDRRVTVSAA